MVNSQFAEISAEEYSRLEQHNLSQRKERERLSKAISEITDEPIFRCAVCHKTFKGDGYQSRNEGDGWHRNHYCDGCMEKELHFISIERMENSQVDDRLDGYDGEYPSFGFDIHSNKGEERVKYDVIQIRLDDGSKYGKHLVNIDMLTDGTIRILPQTKIKEGNSVGIFLLELPKGND